ncbi:MAG TPA: protease inhibitor I42 family protein [Candidatus Dormibacteraeota bacterium]
MPLLAGAMLACGTVATPAAAHTTLTLSQASAGQTVRAKVGDTVAVRLEESFPVPGSALIWDVSTSTPSILRPGRITRDPSARPVRGTVAYTAEFTAAAAGQGVVLARGSRSCEAMPACPGEDFTVTVLVSG